MVSDLMHGKWKVLFIAIILSALVLGCTAPTEKTVKSGDWVSVNYVGRYTNGTVFDTSNATLAEESGIYNPARIYEPLVFQVGQPGLIQGFSDAVIGMKVNETKNVTIPPEKAYGAYNASNVRTVPVETLKANNTNFSLYTGEVILFNDEYVYVAAVGPTNDTAKVLYMRNISPPTPYTVNYNANNDTATIDYNHPMAGKTLVFDITVVAINEGPSPKA
jgi:peptidylprolyl isomerase